MPRPCDGAREAKLAVIYFFRRGDETRMAETRLSSSGDGYELIITEQGQAHTEPFVALPQLLAREHELIQAWRAQGWREAGAPGSRRRGSA
jgi:hypothetical protein